MPDPAPNELKHPVPDKTRYWFGDQMQLVAILHDLAGPDINLIDLDRYRNEVIAEIRTRALTGRATGEVAFEMTDLDEMCRMAADELITLRQIRRARAQGTLPTSAMRRLPAYTAFPTYLDEDPDLVSQGFEAALAKEQARKNERGPCPTPPSACIQGEARPSRTTESFSAGTEQWVETQILGFALSEEMSGRPYAKVDEAKYIAESAPCFRSNILQAIQIGNLNIPPDDVDALCRHAASKALKLRRLKDAYGKGRISRRKLKQMPEYRVFREYLEQAPVMASMMLHAAILNESLAQNENAKTN